MKRTIQGGTRYKEQSLEELQIQASEYIGQVLYHPEMLKRLEPFRNIDSRIDNLFIDKVLPRLELIESCVSRFAGLSYPPAIGLVDVASAGHFGFGAPLSIGSSRRNQVAS